MHCKNCGAIAQGNFCSQCGATLVVEKIKNYTSVKSLLEDQRVKKLIADEVKATTRHISSNEFIKITDKISNSKLVESISFPEMPMSMDIFVNSGRDLWEHLGLKSETSVSKNFTYNYNYSIVSSACYLTKNSFSVVSVEDFSGSCKIVSAIPSNWLTWEGRLKIGFINQENTTQVRAELEFAGQFTDWGRGKKIIDRLFDVIALKCEHMSKIDI